MEQSKYDELIREIANNLDMKFDDSRCYLNVTRMEVIFLTDSLFEQEILPEDGDELVFIEPLSSPESFRIMEDFAEGVRDEKQQERLFRMLSRSHPFSRFKDEIYDSGLENEWFAYRDERMKDFARDWMKENQVEYIGDHLVCNSKHSFSFDREGYMEEYF